MIWLTLSRNVEIVNVGRNEQVFEFIDKTSNKKGTSLNREALMAMQGFISMNTVFKDDGSIEETNSKGQKKITIFNADGSITERFVGEKTITKTTTFDEVNGTIMEVLS